MTASHSSDVITDVNDAVEILQNGGIILYPTDTVWGIGCDATNEKAVAKIYALKKRTAKKAMIVLVAEEKEVLQYVAAPDIAVFDYLKHTRKPTTVIYPNAIGLAANLIADDGSIAIRICADEFCRHLLKKFRKPIVSTSANISEEPTVKIFTAIATSIRQGVDYIVKHRQDDLNFNTPSTIIKWEKGRAILLRP